jgi:hypothetical protein
MNNYNYNYNINIDLANGLIAKSLMKASRWDWKYILKAWEILGSWDKTIEIIQIADKTNVDIVSGAERMVSFYSTIHKTTEEIILPRG